MPFVKWMKGETELTKEEEMPIGRNVLELNNIRQSANYTCVAMSSLGMIETTAQIIVKGKVNLKLQVSYHFCLEEIAGLCESSKATLIRLITIL